MEGVPSLPPAAPEARSVSAPSNGAPNHASATSDASAGDAQTGQVDGFVAALLAQVILPPAAPVAPAVGTGAVPIAGQALPPERSSFAALSLAPRLVGLLPDATNSQARIFSDDAAEAKPTAPFAPPLAALAAQLTPEAATRRSGQTAAPAAEAADDDLMGARLDAATALTTLPDDRGAIVAELDAPATPPLGHATRAAEQNAPAQTYAAKSAPLPFDQPALFAERLNQQIAVMLTEHAQHARIAVNPPDLGPVEVRVTVVGDHASIQLVAAHAATRDALEDALPRLRASFADSGIALGQAGVFAEMPQRQQQPMTPAGHELWAMAGDEAAGLEAVTSERLLKLGLIDAFV